MGEPLVIIGKGMAATKLVEALSARALGRYSIAVIGDEPRRAYNRVLLSSLLARDVASSDLELKSESWWRARGVTTLYGQAAVAVDTKSRTVTLADGLRLSWSKLVFATGSSALKLPLPGAHLEGVMAFRDFEDVDRMQALGAAGRRVVVIGGGLLGLEAAHGLAKAGARVTIVHLMDRLMERQLDHEAAALLKRELESRGIEVLLEASSAAITGETHVEGLRLADGRLLAADAVVMAVGIRANGEIARAAGISVNRGIVVDDRLACDSEGVFALGECAEHRGTVYGLVEPAYEQARVLADNLAGGDAFYEGSQIATNLKVSGVSVFSAGDFAGSEGMQTMTLRDPAARIYKKLVIGRSGDRDVLRGCVLYGDTADGLWYFDLIRSAAPVDHFRNTLIFGRNLSLQEAA